MSTVNDLQIKIQEIKRIVLAGDAIKRKVDNIDKSVQQLLTERCSLANELHDSRKLLGDKLNEIRKEIDTARTAEKKSRGWRQTKLSIPTWTQHLNKRKFGLSSSMVKLYCKYATLSTQIKENNIKGSIKKCVREAEAYINANNSNSHQNSKRRPKNRKKSKSGKTTKCKRRAKRKRVPVFIPHAITEPATKRKKTQRRTQSNSNNSNNANNANNVNNVNNIGVDIGTDIVDGRGRDKIGVAQVVTNTVTGIPHKILLFPHHKISQIAISDPIKEQIQHNAGQTANEEITTILATPNRKGISAFCKKKFHRSYLLPSNKNHRVETLSDFTAKTEPVVRMQHIDKSLQFIGDNQTSVVFIPLDNNFKPFKQNQRNSNVFTNSAYILSIQYHQFQDDLVTVDGIACDVYIDSEITPPTSQISHSLYFIQNLYQQIKGYAAFHGSRPGTDILNPIRAKYQNNQNVLGMFPNLASKIISIYV